MLNIDDKLIMSVWNKWRIIPWQDAMLLRMDRFWSMIKLEEYGNTNSIYWREIDHIIPIDRWWTDLLLNLEPLQWENNRKKSNKLI